MGYVRFSHHSLLPLPKLKEKHKPQTRERRPDTPCFLLVNSFVFILFLFGVEIVVEFHEGVCNAFPGCYDLVLFNTYL